MSEKSQEDIDGMDQREFEKILDEINVLKAKKK